MSKKWKLLITKLGVIKEAEININYVNRVLDRLVDIYIHLLILSTTGIPVVMA